MIFFSLLDPGAYRRKQNWMGWWSMILLSFLYVLMTLDRFSAMKGHLKCIQTGSVFLIEKMSR